MTIQHNSFEWNLNLQEKRHYQLKANIIFKN